MKYFKVLASTLLFAVANLAYALPVLQLGIGGGVYDTSTETIVTTNPTFTLYAYGKATGGNAIDLTETHYISIALVDKIFGKVGPGAPAGGIGSFDFAGASCTGTGGACTIDDMAYGVPPMGSEDLPSHSIYETFFLEIDFVFSGDRTAGVNTQQIPGSDPAIVANGDLYFQAFEVDASFLLSSYQLHFDLYNTQYKNGSLNLDHFAPFSHDAAFVPEPITFALMLLGLAGLGFNRSKRLQ